MLSFYMHIDFHCVRKTTSMAADPAAAPIYIHLSFRQWFPLPEIPANSLRHRVKFFRSPRA